MSDSDKPEAQQPEAQPNPEATAAPPEGEQPAADTPPEAEAPDSGTPTMESKKDLLNRFLDKGRRSMPAGKVPSVEHEQYAGHGQLERNLDDEMERELQEAMGDLSEADLYGEAPAKKKEDAPPGPKKAKVYRVHGQDVFMELEGGRTQGLLGIEQFPEGRPEPGTEVEVSIEGYNRDDGLYILSRKGAAVEADWDSVAVGMTVEARVLDKNKGGLSVDVNGIRGFMPISQIDLYRVDDLDQYVNQKMLCVVAEVDSVMKNLVVSRKGLLEREREETREKLWQTLQEGQKFTGIVRSVKDFGAFVDIGGVDGLLHVSEMSWERVRDASEVVEPGQKIEVVVLKLDHAKRKLSLGAKQLTASPWDDVETKYPQGKTVRGKVSRIADFGAFVELEPAIEGLIHISELASHRVWRVSDVVKVDDEVEVVVVSVDPDKRRIGLSLKAAQPEPATPDPEAKQEEEEPEETKPVKPRKPRSTPLRGGTGDGGPLFKLD